MANHHFGKLADVWKHLVLNEVLAEVRPVRYLETHAGSGAYALTGDAERRFGVLGFLAERRPPLDGTAYARTVSPFVDDPTPTYPGSALQAMTVLGDDAEYVLCDLDGTSAADLRQWAARLSVSRCDVVERDGMATVHERLADRSPAVVHIDPFDPFAHGEGTPSAVGLAPEVAESGHALVYWYGYSNPDQRGWALETIREGTGADLWCGDLLTTYADGSVRDDGDLGNATTPGTGSGVVVANVPAAVRQRCQELGVALTEAYDGRRLPSGEPGGLDFWGVEVLR